MKTHDKIYIYTVSPCDNHYSITPTDNVTDKKYEVEYIRKDALLGWAKELKERWEEPPMSKHSPGCVYMLEQLIGKLNSM